MSNNQSIGNKPITVSSISEFLQHIGGITKTGTINESKLLFKGQKDEKWNVATPAYRRLMRSSKNKTVSEEYELYYNIKLIEQFKENNFHSGYSSEIMKLDLGILAQLQHHGAATSLIDFSANPLVALWSACQESPEINSNNNGKIFILSIEDESNFKEIDIFEEIENYKVSIPDSSQDPRVDGILNNPKFFYWKPAHLSNRASAQQLYFLIGKRKLPKMQQIIIKGNFKYNILQKLSSEYGINAITLFPDLLGFAQANSVHSLYDQEAQNKMQVHIYEKMISRLDKIIKEEPNIPINYKDRGNAKYDLEDYENAIKDFNKAIKFDPNNAVFYAKGGLAEYKFKNYQNAVDNFSKSIELDPNNAAVYAARALAKYNLDDYKSAIDDFNEAIMINPNNALFYNNRSRIKFELKNYQDAINDLNESIRIEPNDTLFYANRGLAKRELEDYENSIDDFNKAIEIEPNNAGAYYNRGYVKSELKDYKGAINDYQTVLKHSKDKNLTESINKILKQIQETLKDLQNKPPEGKE